MSKIRNDDLTKEELKALIDELTRQNHAYQIMIQSDRDFLHKLKHRLILSEIQCLEMKKEVRRLKEIYLPLESHSQPLDSKASEVLPDQSLDQ